MKRILALVLVCFAIKADQITIHNETDYDLFGSMYIFTKKLDRYADVKLIKAHQKEKFERPPFQLFPQRRLVMSLKAENLKPQLTTSEYHILASTSVGVGDHFYIGLDKGSFKGYNAIEWKAIEPVLRKLRGATEKLDDVTLGQMRKLYSDHQFKNVPAAVRVSKDIAQQETEYKAARAKKVKGALEKLLGMPLKDDEVPTISFCGSGGGYRAMLGLLGSMQGAEATGLLNTGTYISGVSGSTWMMGPWLQSGWTLQELRTRLQQKITKDFLAIMPSIPDILNNLLMRLAFKQPIGIINIFGRILAHNLLGDLPGGPLNAYLYQQADRIKNGDWLFPIYNAITTKLPYQWIEFTPFEVGSDYLGGYIPIWAFGSPFLDGKMLEAAPPYHLSYILGICGSAYSARLSHAIEEFKKKIPNETIQKALSTATEDLQYGELAPFRYRPAAADVFNWTYGMQQLPRSQQKLLRLIDAGITYNIGLEALMRRKSNFIVIFDFSASDSVGKELDKAQKELRTRGFAVPPIDFKNLKTDTYTIFKDDKNPETPVIVYIPLVKNKAMPQFDPAQCLPSWCDTFTFNYTVDNSTKLIDLAKKNAEDAAPAILSEIKQWIEKRRK